MLSILFFVNVQVSKTLKHFSIPSKKPTCSPSISPTRRPSHRPPRSPSIGPSTSYPTTPTSAPSSAPSNPTVPPTPVPTSAPSMSTIVCPPYYAYDGIYATCTFTACGGGILGINHCESDTCAGRQYMFLLDSEGNEITSNYGGSGSCGCAQLWAQTPEECTTYMLYESCYFGWTGCTGTVPIAGNNVTFVSSYTNNI